MCLPVYLDYNATTLVDPDVVEAVLPWLRKHFGNPSSWHLTVPLNPSQPECGKFIILRLR